MKYFVTTIASLLATIVAAREGEKAPPAATDDGNIMLRVLALEKIVEEQRVQLEDVHDVISSLHSRRTQESKCFETKGKKVIFKCNVMMRKSLVVNEELTVRSDSFFEGGNVFINNGKDTISEIDGKGNLIVGAKSTDVGANPGSHNVIIGDNHKYSAFAGLVVGSNNEISAEFATVTGGSGNIASGPKSSVTGGLDNKASGLHSTVSGGLQNMAKAEQSSISGGQANEAIGKTTSVAAGVQNHATGDYSAIGGGYANKTPFVGSVVTGATYRTTTYIWENLPKAD